MNSHVYFFFMTSFVVGFEGGVLMTNITVWMLKNTQQHEGISQNEYTVL